MYAISTHFTTFCMCIRNNIEILADCSNFFRYMMRLSFDQKFDQCVNSFDV